MTTDQSKGAEILTFLGSCDLQGGYVGKKSCAEWVVGTAAEILS
jgi:hypothetical protein